MPVYFIRAGSDGPVKIGYSASPPSRLKQLSTMSPLPLHLLRTFDGNASTEKAFHRRFADARLHGEWFEWRPEMLTALPIFGRRKTPSRHRDGYDVPLLLYLTKGQRPALRKRHGARSEAATIRKLVADHLSQKPQ